MKLKHLLLTMCMLFAFANINAQTDPSSVITNQSFENQWTGWTHKNMSLQTNSVFTLKVGNTYVEKWTGRGGSVGDAYLSQVVTGLPPGQYKMRVAAQNIQEDSPTAVQSGAWVFAGDQRTAVNLCDTYDVLFSYVHGDLKIGFEAVGATGNYLCVDYFRFMFISDDLSAELSSAITAAEAVYGDGSGKKAAQLQSAISAAKALSSSASGEEQANAIIALEKASDIYKLANASRENPYNMTDRIENPSFESGDFTGWTSNMAIQGNSSFSLKKGSYYAEKWVNRGSAVGQAYATQTIKNLLPGRYILRAAAQNIQENRSSSAQAGAYLVANTHKAAITTRKEYALEFVLVSDQLTLGFEAEDAKGNWVSVDNFRLEYISDDFNDIKDSFNALISQAEDLVGKRMNATAQSNLQSAINNAKPLASQSTVDGWSEAARQLETAISAAEESQDAFAKLLSTIESCQIEIDGSSFGNKADYQSAIDAARAVYNNSSTTDAQALAAITPLEKAAFAFKIANGSGTAPKVVTDKRFIKGSTWAFGRSTVSGSNILEQGFCWSTDPDPQVTDNRTTEYLNQQGRIYWLRDLKPGTMYYMRAYAITKDYAVGYGDVIKFATVPKGQITHWYNNGGDEATNDRINNAINTSMDYYWNNLTSIRGFGISVSYSPGTPTADCSYGGSMRVGANASYQSAGTIMHEALHGIGVGTHGIWWSAEMRSDGDRGVWLGDRVTEAVRFWDNSTTATITGDNMHLWPYGCNGANEDTHSDNLYCMMGILAQALNEDGLPGSSSIGYALPYYSFVHEDGTKYYIKNEDADRGLYSSYLVETTTHTLQWRTMTADEAAADDAAAWYITFTPSNQFYQFKNAKTGYYLTYSSGFKTVKRTTPTSADNIHLMRGRQNVNVEGSIFRGYYFIHPESTANPPTLAANASNKTASQNFNISKSATTQRWLILTADQAQVFETGSLKMEKSLLTDLLKELRKQAQTPHTENEEGTDATFSSQLNSIESAGNAATTVSAVSNLIAEAKSDFVNFLSNVYVKEGDEPFNLTFMLQNPGFDTESTAGWTTNSTPGYGYQADEFFQSTFNFYQTLQNMPAGTYKLCAQAFMRPGPYSSIYTPYINGTAKVTTQLYIGSTYADVCHICDDRQSSAPSSGCQRMSDGKYIPDNMQSGAAFFAKGLYESSVTAKQANLGNLRVGIRGTSSSSGYWSMFDNFRLYFYGTEKEATGIDDIMLEDDSEVQTAADGKVYNLQGQLMGTSLEGLPAGVYIVNGKKVLKR